MGLRQALQRWLGVGKVEAPTSTNEVDQLRNEIWRLQEPQEMPRRIALCEQALALVDREQNPELWADLQNRLGVSLWENPQGDRAENLERAIAAYEAALQVYTREAFPQQWAMTQNNLGNAYQDRIRGDRAENLERAITAYEAALHIRTREAFPQDWAMTQNNLAGALLDRSELGGDLAERDRAIELLQEALQVSIPGTQNFLYGSYTLGNALFRCYEQTNNRADLDAAVQAYEAAFRSLSPEHYDLPRVSQKLGEAESVVGALLVNEGKWHQGLEFLRSSLGKLQKSDDLLAHANALYQTGRANELLSHLLTARTYYRDALRLYEQLENQEGVARSRSRLGSVLVACGYLEAGVKELATAQELYQQLGKPEKAADLDDILQASRNILEGKPIEEIRG